jgi:probable HAF family extracellular repeat protein
MKRQAFVPLAVFGAILATVGPAHAEYVFTTITPPGAAAGDFVFANAINDNGQVVVTAEVPNTIFDFTVVDDVYNINTQTYTAFPAVPGATPNSTEAYAINDIGVVVGIYHPAGGIWQGFSDSGGVFSSVDAFGSNDTFPFGISNNGQIVGVVNDASGASQGYVYSNGQYQIVDGDPYPANSTLASGINDSGEIILTSSPSGSTGFNCDSFLNVGGVNTPISMPGVSNTCAEAINDAGAIVGAVSNDGYVTGSGFVDVDGVYTALNFPGATLTEAYGINNLGQIVGTYTDANGNEQAFLATPTPEPGTWAMILGGLASLGAAKLMRGRRRA